MAYGNIDTFYLPALTIAGLSQHGTDVRRLVDAADPALTETTITNHGTGAAVTRTHDPFTTTSSDLAQADYGFAVRPHDMQNLLTADEYDFETSTAGWSITSGGTLARSTAQFNTGVASLQASRGSAPTNYGVASPIKAGVVPGCTVQALAYLRPNTTARTIQIVVTWYTAADALISTSFGASVSDTAGAWTLLVDSTLVAPATAAKASVGFIIYSAGAGESHFIDTVRLYPLLIARRFIPAGTHTVTARINNNTNILAKSNCRLDCFVYRVGPAFTRTRTLLDSFSSALFSTAASNAYVTVTASKSLAEIILGDDETLQISTELNASGSAITGETYTFALGTQGGVAIKWQHPGLKVLADGAGTATGSGAANGVATGIFSGVGSIAGVGAASAQASWVASGVGSAAGIAEALGIPATTWSFTGVAAGVGDASGVMTGIFSTEAIAAGIAAMDGVATGIFSAVGTSAGAAEAEADAGWIFTGVGQIAGVAEVLGLMSSVAGTVGSAEGTSEALGLPSKVLGMVGTVDIGGDGGGGETIIRPLILLSDD